MASKPEYKEAYEKFIEFSEMVRLNGIRIGKENYFSNVVVDFAKFVIYLEKCVLRSVVVRFCGNLGASRDLVDGTYYGFDFVPG